MTCDEARELLAGYVMDALDERETEQVDAHLAGCREHDDELVDLRATHMALALLEDAAEPSPHLRDRVLAVAGPAPVPLRPRLLEPADRLLDDGLDADLSDEELAEIERLAALDEERERRAGGIVDRPLRPRPGGWWLIAAAASIAIVMFGAGWAVGQRNAPAAQQAVRYSYEMRGAGGELVRFAGIEGSQRVTVTMDGIEAQPEGRQYQVWAIRDGKWVSLGHCNTNAKGWWKGDFEFTLQRGEEVALTIEPAGGSPKPTTAAILRTKL